MLLANIKIKEYDYSSLLIFGKLFHKRNHFTLNLIGAILLKVGMICNIRVSFIFVIFVYSPTLDIDNYMANLSNPAVAYTLFI